MHLHFERNDSAKCDCTILSLSWMGKVPDELPEDEGWKLNRTNYYQEGWLATGNVRGIVGVTFTTSHCKKVVEYPLRTNYNLRGHRSEVSLVKWNEPYQKLMSCDSTGVIFVWIKYDGRWSIELINDRNSPVAHFSWSHDGRMALICYRDGFVLVGSVAGQRYWSSMLNLESTITCGVWTPDDQQVYFATTMGRIVVMDVHGAMVAQVQLAEVGITAMAWSCEKFKMEENDDIDNGTHNERPSVLAVCLENGYIFFMKSHDDVSPAQVCTGLVGPLHMEWSNSRELLAVAGALPSSGSHYDNVLHFYTETGTLLYTARIPDTQHCITAMTWGHNDRRLLVATGPRLHVAWVSARRVAALQLLARLAVYGRLQSEKRVEELPLPPRVHALIASLFRQTIRCCMENGLWFVSRPPGSARLHCTMIRHDGDDGSAPCYTLYLEYLGGLVALLKGRRRSKIRPEFIIYDPTADAGTESSDSSHKSPSPSSGATNGHDEATSSDRSDDEASCARSPRMARRRRRNNRRSADEEDLTYVDTLPERARLVEVSSNIWGTRFKIHGISPRLPACLGSVAYKTSLLHLQPRQMTLTMAEMTGEAAGEEGECGGRGTSDEEEEEVVQQQVVVGSPLIAPLTPRLPTERRNRDGKSPGSEDFQPRLQTQSRPPIGQLDGQLRLPLQPRPSIGQLDMQRSSAQSPIGHRGLVQSPIGPSDLPRALIGPSHNHVRHSLAGDSSIEDILVEASSSIGADIHNRIKSNFQESCQEDPRRKPHTDRLLLKLNLEAGLANVRRGKSSPSGNQVGIASRQPPAEEMLFIDDEGSTPGAQAAMVRSCSVGYLDLVDSHVGGRESSRRDHRLVLVRHSKHQRHQRRRRPRACRKSRSLDSGDLAARAASPAATPVQPQQPQQPPVEIAPRSPRASLFRRRPQPPPTPPPAAPPPPPETATPRTRRRFALAAHFAALASRSRSRSEDARGGARSQPCSPQMPKKSDVCSSPLRRRLLDSPLLRRRPRRRSNKTESSDEEATQATTTTAAATEDFHSLETFQKSQLKQKLRRGKEENSGCPSNGRKVYVMHNKAPMWNENSQVYQLDFGGRVTQESAKNFQIEFRGKQVMQFGRIDGNAYTLDFQYPFSALQAFAVALANVTQRLK